MSALEARKGFGCDPRPLRHVGLLEAELFASGRNCDAKFLEGFHLMYVSRIGVWVAIIDANIKLIRLGSLWLGTAAG